MSEGNRRDARRLARASIFGVIVLATSGIGRVAVTAWADAPPGASASASEGALGSRPATVDVVVESVHVPSGAVQSGDAITRTMTVTNVGDGTATDVELTSSLAAGTTLRSTMPGCAEGTGVVTCDLGDIGSGAHVPVEIVVTVDAGVCGAIVAGASVSSANESLGAAANNASNAITNTVGCEPTPPDLQVIKTSDADGVLEAGDELRYTIAIRNVGEQTATGVEVHDVLPPGVQVRIPPLPSLGGAACTVASSVVFPGVPVTTVDCGPTSIEPGVTTSVDVRVRVTDDVCGPITNVVDVEGSNEPDERIGDENHAEVSDDVLCVPRIRLRTAGPARAHLGDVVTYRFAATNTGGADLSTIELHDPSCDGAARLTDVGDGNDVLSVSETWRFECEGTVTDANGDQGGSEATVTGHHAGGTVSDSDRHDVDVIHPQIRLRTWASPTSGPVGTLVVVTYEVTNTGDTALIGVSVDDDVLGHFSTVGRLAPGQTIRSTHAFTLGPSPITSVGTAGGRDVLGLSVGDTDSATVMVVPSGRDGGDGRGAEGGTPFTGFDAGVMAGRILFLAALGMGLVFAGSRRSGTTG